MSVAVNEEDGQFWIPPLIVRCSDDDAIFESEAVSLEWAASSNLARFALLVDPDAEELGVVSLGLPGSLRGNVLCTDGSSIRFPSHQRRGVGKPNCGAEPRSNSHLDVVKGVSE